MQHRGIVCATLLFLAAALVLPAAPAAAEPGLVRVSDVFAGLWDWLDRWADVGSATEHAVRPTGAALSDGSDVGAFTLPLGDGGDGSQTTEVLDADDPPTDLKGGFDVDG